MRDIIDLMKRNAKNRKRFSSYLLIFLVVLSSILGFSIQAFSKDNDALSNIDISGPYESTIIYSSDGAVLGTIHAGQKRISVPLSQISPYLIKAVIASEDSDFFNHRGISVKAILRAGIANILHGRIAQGGSTITQQLARTLFLTNKKTVFRKVSEMYYALELEKKYTKEEILEMYLNQVYWGHNTYGADTASQTYFGKHASALTLGESAMLAGILGAPEIYSPYKNFDLAIRRRASVLEKMLRLGMVSKNDVDSANNEKVTLSMAKINKYKFIAPYFTNYVINQLVEKYGRDAVYKGGLRIYTTLSLTAQKYAENAVSTFLTKEGKKFNFSQAALVAIDPKTGSILAMIGGGDVDKSEFNRAVQAKRSPGSSFKPFVYTTALEKRISPGEIVYDSPTVFDVFADKEHPDGKWSPKNFDRKFRGPVTYQYALENSLNIPAIKLLQAVGAENAIDVAKRMGITSKLEPSLSLTLGTNDVSLLEMTSAFGVFANGGVRAEPISIIKVTGKDGKILEESRLVTTRVLDANVAGVMVEMMKGVITSGTGRRANIGRSAAAKTGTSDNFKDAWFVGFIPQIVAGVWVGNDNNSPMKGVAEVAVCPRMWKMFMDSMIKDIPVEDFPKPGDTVNVKICTVSGLLPGEYCPKNKIKWSVFWSGKEPKSFCTLSHGVNVAPEEEETTDENTEETGENDFKEESF